MKKIYLTSPELREESLPLPTPCNSVQRGTGNFPQILSEPISLFLSILHIYFHTWFCSFTSRYCLTETLYFFSHPLQTLKLQIILYSHPNLIILNTFSAFTFVLVFPFLIDSGLHVRQAVLSILTLLLLECRCRTNLCVSTSREVFSKPPRQVMSVFNSISHWFLKVSLMILRVPPRAKSFIHFCSFLCLFSTLSPNVTADNYALFSGLSPSLLKVGLFSQQKADS